VFSTLSGMGAMVLHNCLAYLLFKKRCYDLVILLPQFLTAAYSHSSCPASPVLDVERPG